MKQLSWARDHTERLLPRFSCPVRVRGNSVFVKGCAALTAASVHVPGDFSSAAFFIVAALLVKGSSICLQGVGINPTRTGLLDILVSMGAKIRCEQTGMRGEEPVANIFVQASALKAVTVTPKWVALAIDEMPVLMVAAACAEGVTSIRGARELRVKESDRLSVMAAGLMTLGIRCRVLEDGIDIEGGVLQGGEVDAASDHRVAMAFLVAASCARGAVRVKQADQIATSFPQFLELSSQLGMQVSQVLDVQCER